MRKSSIFFLSIFTLIIIVSGCNHNKENYISEGIIEFDAVAVDKDNSMAAFAPSKMTVKFKNNCTRADVSAGMGLLKMAVVFDEEKRTMIEMVKLFNNKFVNVLDSNGVKKENSSFPPYKLIETKDKKTIAGYVCKRAIVSFMDSTAKFDIFYTDDIDIKNPNWSNQFHAVSGVLMEYQVKRHGLEMRFTAKSVTKSEIEDNSFELPDDYELISKEKMDEQFQSFE